MDEFEFQIEKVDPKLQITFQYENPILKDEEYPVIIRQPKNEEVKETYYNGDENCNKKRNFCLQQRNCIWNQNQCIKKEGNPQKRQFISQQTKK